MRRALLAGVLGCAGISLALSGDGEFAAESGSSVGMGEIQKPHRKNNDDPICNSGPYAISYYRASSITMLPGQWTDVTHGEIDPAGSSVVITASATGTIIPGGTFTSYYLRILSPNGTIICQAGQSGVSLGSMSSASCTSEALEAGDYRLQAYFGATGGIAHSTYNSLLAMIVR